jgi:hypothetical protein
MFGNVSLKGVSFDWKIIYGWNSKDVHWFRLSRLNYGLCLKRTKKLFSERYGYTKYMSLPFGWRITILKGEL